MYLIRSISSPLCLRFTVCVVAIVVCVCVCVCGHTVCYPPRLLHCAAMSQIGPLMLMLCLWETRVRPHRTQRACYTVTHNKRQAEQRGELRDGHTHCVTAAARGSSGGLELPQRRSQRFLLQFFCSRLCFPCAGLHLKSIREADGGGPRVCMCICIYLSDRTRESQRDKGASG